MKLYEIQATEKNGEQEYAQTVLVYADDESQAFLSAREYFKNWYEHDEDEEPSETDDPRTFSFPTGNGEITLHIDEIIETEKRDFLREMFERYLIETVKL